MQRYLNMKYVKGVKIVHTHIIDTGFNLEVSLNNKFISMYAEFHNLEDRSLGFWQNDGTKRGFME